MKTNGMTLSAPGQSTRPLDKLQEVLNREVAFIHETTHFSLTLSDAIRVLLFSLLITAALCLHFDNSLPWQILCAAEAVHLVIPALRKLINQCN